MLPPSTTTAQMMAKAAAAARAGQTDTARALYAKLLRGAPNLAEAHRDLGRLELAAGHPKRALRSLTTARKIKPADPDTWLASMDALAALRDTKGMRALLAKAKTARLGPQVMAALQARAQGTSPEAAFDAALRMFRAGDWAGALAGAQALHAKLPKAAPPVALMAACQARMGQADAAADSYRRALALDPDYTQAHEQFGTLLVETGDLPAARTHLGAALARMPGSAAARLGMGKLELAAGAPGAALPHLAAARDAIAQSGEPLALLAQAHLAMGNAAQALSDIDAALEHAPKAGQWHHLRGQILAELDRGDDALAALDRALTLGAPAQTVQVDMAHLLNDLGRFDDMARIVEGMMGQGRMNPGLLRLYARSRTAPVAPDIIAAAERAFDAMPARDEARASMAFALSKMLDDADDPAAAFRFMKAGNDTLAALYPPDRALDRARADLVARTCARGLPASAVPAPGDGPRPVFVTGMARSGTTLIEQILGSHPDVTPLGEADIAGAELVPLLQARDGAGAALTAADLSDLRRAVLAGYAARANGAPLVADKALNGEQIAPLVHAILPEAVMIVVRRDPRDNCLSMFKNMFPPGTHRATTELAALARACLDHLDDLARMRRDLPGIVHEIRYEDLIADPEPRIRALLDICGLDWDDRCLSFHETDRQVRTLSSYQVRQPLFSSSVGAWRRYADGLAPMIDILRAGGALNEWESP